MHYKNHSKISLKDYKSTKILAPIEVDKTDDWCNNFVKAPKYTSKIQPSTHKTSTHVTLQTCIVLCDCNENTNRARIIISESISLSSVETTLDLTASFYNIDISFSVGLGVNIMEVINWSCSCW